MLVVVEEIAGCGVRFLVAVRRDAAGRRHSLADTPVPERFAGLFTQIPETRFRVDASSTELRTT